MDDISKIFVVNLDDKKDRFEKFKKLNDSRLERFSAVDARFSANIAGKYGFKLKPVSLSDNIYFYTAPGAVGIYLSFYLIWKKIVSEDIPVSLILEDDASVEDIKKYLNENEKIDFTDVDFVQLGKRCDVPWVPDITKNFDGLEAHILTKRGAEKLISATENPSHFNGVVNVKPNGWCSKTKRHLNDFDVFKKEKTTNWTNGKLIRCAVDKFVGYCGNQKHSDEKRLKILHKPTISLSTESKTSDILKDVQMEWYRLPEDDLCSLINSEDFSNWRNANE